MYVHKKGDYQSCVLKNNLRKREGVTKRHEGNSTWFKERHMVR